MWLERQLFFEDNYYVNSKKYDNNNECIPFHSKASKDCKICSRNKESKYIKSKLKTIGFNNLKICDAIKLNLAMWTKLDFPPHAKRS